MLAITKPTLSTSDRGKPCCLPQHSLSNKAPHLSPNAATMVTKGSPERTTTAGGALPTGSTSASNRMEGAGGRIPPQSDVNPPPAQQPTQTTWPQDPHPMPQQQLWQSGGTYAPLQQAPTQPQQPVQHAAHNQPMAPTYQWRTSNTDALPPDSRQGGTSGRTLPARTASLSKPAGNPTSTTVAT